MKMALTNYGSANYGLKDWIGDSSASNHNSEMRLLTAKLAGFEIDASESEPTIVCIENLSSNVTEEFLFILFGQIGLVTKARLFADGLSRYAFLKFADHQSAAHCVIAMDKKLLHNKEIRVRWATGYNMQRLKADINSGFSPHCFYKLYQQYWSNVGQFHVFVGDLSPDMDSKALYEIFAELGDITDVKVIRDPLTTKSKGYGFVSFAYREQAENAIEKMNGHLVGNRPIRTNWASCKSSLEVSSNSANVTIEEIFRQTGPENTSVYVGNMPSSCSEGDIRLVFKQFGEIYKVRHFKHLGYSFVSYTTKQAASKAILEMNGREFMGQKIKCSWGKGDMVEGVKARSPQNLVDLPTCYASNPLAGAFNEVNMSSTNAAASANIHSYWNLFQQYCQNNPLYQQQWQSHWEQKSPTRIVKRGDGR